MACSSLDLFSGIGGITVALESMLTPVAYCDIDPFARKVLERHMADGSLPRARVYEDVRALDPAELPQVDVVVGGFPCVGFSTMGSRRGLEDPRSGLFAEMVRIVSGMPRLPILFLENVPAIVTDGLGEVVDALINVCGYTTVHWCVVGACDVGAHHRRARWFCMAHTESHTDLREMLSSVPEDARVAHEWPARWGGECPHDRMTLSDRAGAKKRIFALGNSVVPPAVYRAFRHLVSDADGPRRPHKSYKWPLNGGVCASATGMVDVYACDPPKPLVPMKDLRLLFDPTRFQPPEGFVDRTTSPKVKCVAMRPLWATPTTPLHPQVHLTSRSINDLRTQLRFEVGTPDHLRGGVPAPEFVEWLMGYPKGWTGS